MCKKPRTCGGCEGPASADSGSARRRARGDGAAGKSHLGEAGWGGGGEEEKEKNERETLSENCAVERERERKKEKKEKIKIKKRKKAFSCACLRLCARIPFAPSLRETRGGSPKRSHATLSGRCCRESSSRRRVLAPGRVSLSFFFFFAMLFFDAFGDVENAVDSSDIARISPASRASLPRSPLQSRA